MKKEPDLFGNAPERVKKQARSTWARLGILMALLLAAGVLLWQGSPGGRNGLRGAPEGLSGQADDSSGGTQGSTGGSSGGLPGQSGDSSGGTQGLPDGSSGGSSADSSADPASPGPAQHRTARELAYHRDVEALQELTQRESLGQEARDQAADRLTRLITEHQAELGIQEALNRAGFPTCAVVLQNDAITVTMGGRTLTATESATILAVCVAHSDIAVDNIRMMTGE